MKLSFLPVLMVALLVFAGCVGQQENPTEYDGTEPEPENSSTEEFAVSEPDVVIRLSGRNFEYEDENAEINPELRVQQGDVVRVEYTTESGFHDFVIDEYGSTEQVRAEDGMQVLIFTADQAGEFEYYCSVGSHREMGMAGKLIVE